MSDSIKSVLIPSFVEFDLTLTDGTVHPRRFDILDWALFISSEARVNDDTRALLDKVIARVVTDHGFTITTTSAWALVRTVQAAAERLKKSTFLACDLPVSSGPTPSA